MITVQELKEKYSRPIKFNDRTFHTEEECYCVGGALGLHLKSMGICDPLQLDLNDIGEPRSECPNTFPNSDTLGKLLQHAVPGLGATLAHSYALNIIRANDANRFHDAWDELNRALTYQPPIHDVLAAKEKSCSASNP